MSLEPSYQVLPDTSANEHGEPKATHQRNIDAQVVIYAWIAVDMRVKPGNNTKSRKCIIY